MGRYRILWCEYISVISVISVKNSIVNDLYIAIFDIYFDVPHPLPFSTFYIIKVRNIISHSHCWVDIQRRFVINIKYFPLAFRFSKIKYYLFTTNEVLFLWIKPKQNISIVRTTPCLSFIFCFRQFLAL